MTFSRVVTYTFILQYCICTDKQYCLCTRCFCLPI